MKHYYVEGKTLPEAYHNALLILNKKGETVPCPAYNTITKECGMTMYVENAMAEPMISRCWIGGHHELQQYLMEISEGILDFMIGVDDNTWEYTYHDRIKYQIPFVIEELRRDPYSRRAIIDVRKNNVDMDNGHPACLQNMGFMIRDNKLDLVVTMRSNDGPEATFMNAFAFIMGIQKYIVDQLNIDENLNIEVGSYTHIAYSFHCYEKDFKKLDDFCKRIKSGSNTTYNYIGFYKKLMEDEIASINMMVHDQHEKYYGIRKEYDMKGNLIHEYSHDYDKQYKYDENNNLIHYKNSNGEECWYGYDENGKYNYFRHKFPNGSDYSYEYDKYTDNFLPTDVNEYDENNNLIHYKDSDDEWWKKYDEKGNLIYYRDHDGYEEWYKYDNNNNNLIHCETSKGFEEWIDFDKNGNEIHFTNSEGYEEYNEYDENNNLIHLKTSDGYEEWYKYDDNNNLIHCETSDGYEQWNKYDEKGNVTHFKNSNDYEEWYEYDEKGNVIHFKDSDGYEYWKDYNENHNKIHFKNSVGYEKWKDYDENHNEIHYKDSDGFEYWKDYNEENSLIHYRHCSGVEYWFGYDKNNTPIRFENYDEYEEWKNKKKIFDE